MIKFIVIIIMVFYVNPAFSNENVCSLPIHQLLSEIRGNDHYDEQIPSQLMMIRGFVALKICAPIRFNEYLEFLPQISEEDARILIYAAQSLKGKSYLNFGEGIISLIQGERISNSTLRIFIFPGYDWNTMLVENFGDPEVVDFLNKSKFIISDKRGAIAEIITGHSLGVLIDSRLNQTVSLNNI